MNDPVQSPQAEKTAVQPQTGTVQDVRPMPPLDQKDPPTNDGKESDTSAPQPLIPQEGRLTDSINQQIKTFRANLNPALRKGELVYYQDLPKPSPHDAVVIGRR